MFFQCSTLNSREMGIDMWIKFEECTPPEDIKVVAICDEQGYRGNHYSLLLLWWNKQRGWHGYSEDEIPGDIIYWSPIPEIPEYEPEKKKICKKTAWCHTNCEF